MEYLTINSFETKRSVTIDSLKTHFLPIQEGEGDPSPDNIRPITGWNSIKVRKCGKNLAKIVGYSATNVDSSTSTRMLTNRYGTTINSTDNVDELIITQSDCQAPDTINSSKNGYFSVVLDNLPFEKAYNVSFKVTNIVSNPLNAQLEVITVYPPSGTGSKMVNVREDDRLFFKNLLFRKHPTILNRCSIEIRNCGMSFTLSEFMVTAVEDEDFTYEPYREEEVEVELHGKNFAPSIDEWQDGYINGNGTISSPANDQNEKYCNFIKVSPNTPYIFSFSLTNAPSKDLWACIATYDKDKNLIRRYSYNPSLGTESHQSIITEENCNYIACSFRTFNMVDWVQLEMVEVNEVLNKKSKWVDGYISSNPSVPVSPDATRKEITSDFIDIGSYNANKVGFYYSFNNVPPDNNWVGVVFCDENKSYLSRPTKFPGTNLISINGFFEIPEDARYIRFSFRSYGDVKNISVFLCNDSNVTYEPYTNTFYGGYVDITKGELVQEYVCEEPNDRDWIIATSYAYQPGHSMCINTTSSSIKLMVCTHWINKKFDNPEICSINNNKFMVVCRKYFEAANVSMDNESIKAHFAELKANGTPFKICSPLLTPIHYPIPTETLKTLRGFNTIFSTTNDSIEVGYSELSPMSLLELRRSIIASEPHLVTVETGNTEDSDVIASFKTNAALPLKSMIVNFEPKQEGEGDPSPDNIRPITGLSELEIHNYPHLVQWNQWLQPLTEDNWRAYDTSNNTVTFSEDGIATNEWVNTRGGYSSSIRNKVGTPQSEGQVWYVSYMVRHHGQDTKIWQVECCGGRQIRGIVDAEPEIWYQVSAVTTYNRGTRNYVYIGNIADIQAEPGLTADVKAPIHINLTQMYGAGNEPTKEEFEAQCALNGIDLTTYNPYDEGTVIPWRMSADEDRVYQIPLTLPNLITPEPKSITSYNVDFTVNEDGTVDYEGTPTSYSSVYIGSYYVKGGETITVTLCGDIANLCFNAQALYDSSNNRISFLGNVNNYEGKITYTIDLSEYPDAYRLAIVLKRYRNDVYMKGRCWVRVVEGSADTGDEVFGGYIDLENNELVATYGKKKIFGNENWIISGGISGYCACRPTVGAFAPEYSGYVKPICNKLSSVAKWATKLYEATINNYGNFYFGAPEELSTKEAVNEWVKEIGGIDVVYPLATPLHFPLSPTVIRTLKGMNNIYTNANGKSTIKYWTH